MLQLRPLRAYFVGEVVCVPANNMGGADDGALMYAEVDEAPGRGGAAMDVNGGQIALRVGSGRALMHCMPLHVHSFRTRLRPLGISPSEGSAEGSAPDPNAADGEEGPHDASSGSAPPRGPSAAELVDAVASVLRRAGAPMGAETQQMLESNLRMQSELLQARSDAEDRAIEAARAKEALETAERSIQCQVCMTRRVDTVLSGCGHVLCAVCADQIHDRCPYCRDPLTGGTCRLRW
jgi:hypothetical protein